MGGLKERKRGNGVAASSLKWGQRDGGLDNSESTTSSSSWAASLGAGWDRKSHNLEVQISLISKEGETFIMTTDATTQSVWSVDST